MYAYNDAALEILREAQRCGLFTVLEQTIAPLAIESRLLDAERAKYPDWEERDVVNTVFVDRCLRQQQEWEAADLIICGSDFVAEGIRQAGGPFERCRVVPYGVDSTFRNERLRSVHNPLRVLTVGAAGLRKGMPYVWSAARAMGRSAEFRVVGPIQISAAARYAVEKDVQLMGSVPRNEMRKHYEWADVFLLPSICEGSATASYEALAAGLPVICTHNTGSVVTDGLDGFIVPVGEHHGIVEKLQLLTNSRVLESMSAAALAKAQLYDLESYGRRALQILATTPIP